MTLNIIDKRRIMFDKKLWLISETATSSGITTIKNILTMRPFNSIQALNDYPFIKLKNCDNT